MELEFHQLDLRYEHLRRHNPEAERQLLSALADNGQKVPVVVLALGQDRYVLLDGYKRFRALRRLKRDTLQATLWDLEEADALLLERMMRTSEPDGPLEQAWFLCELRDRFRIPPEELARRFDRTASWVSRRLAMVRDYPRAPLLAAIQTAQEYGLFDLDRLDRMVLRHIAKDYFVLGTAVGDPGHDPEEDTHEG